MLYDISALKCLKKEKFNTYSMNLHITFKNGEMHCINDKNLYDIEIYLVLSEIIGYL